jgi:hypothetical protein
MLPRPSPSVRVAARPYTRRVVATDRCSICGGTFGFTLALCSLCHHSVCDSCAVRRGGVVFCGAGCAHLFFFGESDEEDLPESETEE